MSTREAPQQGWALKWQRKGQRATENAKKFRVEKFNRGVTTGNKEDPATVAREMRVARDESGKLCFAPEEWRTAKQIVSYFSRLAATQRQLKAPGEPLVEQDEVISEEDLQARETERQLQELHTAVNEEVNLKHPIEYNRHDICGLTKRGMLNQNLRLRN
ncbi:hypothetical protein AWC38_SpisGene1492 [Stylophora pistillata]|uniref:Uncharacterized protein n=1 Tax=Stylophora pistillata TaxID=50429 RepID=A0A2B4SYI0_STYPI|nr:hypothetical protein AWC38_SpisGene1492 [Stylophora pistillata]